MRVAISNRGVSGQFARTMNVIKAIIIVLEDRSFSARDDKDISDLIALGLFSDSTTVKI